VPIPEVSDSLDRYQFDLRAARVAAAAPEAGLEAVLPLKSTTFGILRLATGLSQTSPGSECAIRGTVPIDIARDTATPRFRTVCWNYALYP
jgi:hypothetical protein